MVLKQREADRKSRVDMKDGGKGAIWADLGGQTHTILHDFKRGEGKRKRRMWKSYSKSKSSVLFNTFNDKRFVRSRGQWASKQASKPACGSILKCCPQSKLPCPAFSWPSLPEEQKLLTLNQKVGGVSFGSIRLNLKEKLTNWETWLFAGQIKRRLPAIFSSHFSHRFCWPRNSENPQ